MLMEEKIITSIIEEMGLIIKDIQFNKEYAEGCFIKYYNFKSSTRPKSI